MIARIVRALFGEGAPAPRVRGTRAIICPDHGKQIVRVDRLRCPVCCSASWAPAGAPQSDPISLARARRNREIRSCGNPEENERISGGDNFSGVENHGGFPQDSTENPQDFRESSRRAKARPFSVSAYSRARFPQKSTTTVVTTKENISISRSSRRQAKRRKNPVDVE